jgi:2-polyprenyl-3-methyl-5-hydroxy-6-metoxy-1,4-benzoquinol methylase
MSPGGGRLDHSRGLAKSLAALRHFTKTIMQFPEYDLFRAVCQSGLAAVRPLLEASRADDPDGWNYGSGWPPSYRAYGRMRAIVTLLTARSLRPRRALEVAAGDAALCASLATDGCEVFANDLREEVLKAAVAKFANGNRINLLPGNLLAIDPARVGRFDLVVACEVLEHVARPVPFLRHLKSLVTTNGHILITTPNGGYFRNRLPTYAQIKDFSELEAQQFKPDADGHLFLVTPTELRSIATEAGLRLAQVDLWGTPILTGHGAMRVFSGRIAARAGLARICFTLERFAQRLPARAKERLCFSIFAVLSPSL